MGRRILDRLTLGMSALRSLVSLVWTVVMIGARRLRFLRVRCVSLTLAISLWCTPLVLRFMLCSLGGLDVTTGALRPFLRVIASTRVRSLPNGCRILCSSSSERMVSSLSAISVDMPSKADSWTNLRLRRTMV